MTDSAKAPGPPWQLEWHPTIDSTMTRAAELAAAGAPSGTVVVADFQSQGRGTKGRAWIAPPGSCLMFTLVARPRWAIADLEQLPLAIATDLASCLRQITGIAVDVKAPNDLVVSGRKLCGVLCTSRVIGERIEWVLCGVGLNTQMTRDELPIADATSLAIEGVTPVPRHPELLESLLGSIAWLLDGSSPCCADYAAEPILSSVEE